MESKVDGGKFIKWLRNKSAPVPNGPWLLDGQGLDYLTEKRGGVIVNRWASTCLPAFNNWVTGGMKP